MPRSNPESAFTRLDLCAVAAGLLLLLCLVLPALSASDAAADRQTCKNNLRLIGSAFQTWMKDHDNRVHWTVPSDQGGSFGHPGAENAWFQMLWLSNNLTTPAHLACPSDKVRVASTWTRDREGGFLNGGYRGNSLSYFLGLDGRNDAPKALLSGDRNLLPVAERQECDYAGVRSAVSLSQGESHSGWTSAVHGAPGNILFFDGQVDTPSSAGLAKALAEAKAVHPDNHALLPR